MYGNNIKHCEKCEKVRKRMKKLEKVVTSIKKQ